MIKAVNAILISSANPKRLIEFYEKFGIQFEIADHGGGLHAETDFGDVHFAIWSGGGPGVERNNVSFSFHVPELEKFCAELSQKGVRLDGPQPLPFGGVVASTIDPDGNRVVLMRWNSDLKD